MAHDLRPRKKGKNTTCKTVEPERVSLRSRKKELIDSISDAEDSLTIGDDENESGSEPDMNSDDGKQVEIPTTSLTSLIFKDMGSHYKQDVVKKRLLKLEKKREKLVAMACELEEPQLLFEDITFKKKRPLDTGQRKLQDAPLEPG